MLRFPGAAAATVGLVVLSSAPLSADVRADERTQTEFAGVLGRMTTMFGGKAARDGITTTVAVKGDRKVTLNEETAQIIDLSEEKVYDLDIKKKTYKVTTFAELRRRMEDAQKKAQENARKAQSDKPSAAPAQSSKQMEIDFDVKNTGQKKVINGYDTHEVVMTVTAREKGKKLEESGGLVLTSNMWLAPKISAMKEIAEFDSRFAQKVYGSMVAGVSPEQMAAALAMYPMMKDTIGRMNVERGKLDGTAILTTTTTDSVKSAEQLASDARQREEGSASSGAPASVGGLVGGFARNAAQKKAQGDAPPQQRATLMTATHEVLKVTSDVAFTYLTIPVGFKENK
jgi:hypothetical protein